MNASHKNLLFQRRCIFQSLKVIDSGLQKVTLFRQHLVQIYLSAWFISWCGKFEKVCLFKAATTLRCIKIKMQRFDKWCPLELGQIGWDCKDFFLTNSINASKCLEVNELCCCDTQTNPLSRVDLCQWCCCLPYIHVLGFIGWPKLL